MAAEKRTQKEAGRETKPPTAGAAPVPKTAAVPGAAAAGPKAAAKPEPVSITAANPSGILEQLSSVPPTQAATAYEQAEAASADVLEKQAAEAREELPEIPAPTGLPAQDSAARKEKATPETAKTPKAAPSGEKSGREEPPYETQVEAAPPAPPPVPTKLPGPEVAADSEVAAAELAANAQNALKEVDTDVTAVSVSAGERPAVDTTGEADPSQLHSFEQESAESVRTATLEATQESYADFGENNIFPKPSNETLKATSTFAAVKPAPGAAPEPLALPPEAVGGLNESLGPVFAERVGAKKNEYDTGEGKFEQDKANAHADAKADITSLEDEARETQVAEQKKAKEAVGGAREEWRADIGKVEKDYHESSEKAGKEQRTKIDKEKTKGEEEADRHLKEAEKEATKEKSKAEKEAEEKKKEAEEDSDGFWGWVKSKAKALIDGLKAALNFVYDNLRKAVKAIFEAAKKLVLAAIELARKAIVGLIKAFGAVLKGVVDIAFFAFPGIKKKINAKIDQAVDGAVSAVNKAADVLKKGVAAVLDFLAKTIDSLLGLIQSLYNGILTVIGMIISGEFVELMRRIGHLIDAAKTVPDQFETAALEELLGGNLDEPLSPVELMQAGEAPPAAKGEGAPPLEAAEPSELPMPPWTENNVGVDQIDPDMELSPELAEDLVTQTGGEGEVEIASSEDDTRTMTAVMAEVSPGGEATAKAGGEEEPKYPDDGLTPGKRAEIKWKLMKKGIADWWSQNWPTVIAAAAAALLGFIALEIVTGGAITAAIPAIMSVVGPLFVGMTVLTLADRVKDYVEKGWEGQIEPAGKSLAKGLAAGAIELISYLTFKAGGAALKGAKALAKGAKAVAGAGIKLAKAGVQLIKRGIKFVISKAKVLFQGITRGFGKTFARLKQLGEGLLKRLRFRKFRIRLEGRSFILEGYINPWVLLAKGELAKGDIRWLEKAEVIEGKTAKFGEKIVGRTATGEEIEGLFVGASKSKPNYRKIADLFYEEQLSQANVIHHAVEQQVLKKFPNLFKLEEIHSGSNLRAILKGTFNSEVHLSKIRILWNDFYELMGSLKLSADEARKAFSNFRSYVDSYIKAMTKFMSTDEAVLKAAAAGDRDTVRALLAAESTKLLKDAKQAARSATGSVTAVSAGT